MNDSEHHENNDSELKSKSRLKREADALQKAGEDLIGLSAQALDKLDIPGTLRLAIDEAKRITSRSAMRRQKQYIGRLMRELDSTVLLEQLDALHDANRNRNEVFHLIENWRDRLITGDDQTINDFIQQYPDADRQMIRQLSRNAKTELNKAQAPKASRQLFKLLRDIIEQ